MTKRRATVTGWDPTYVNPNATTGRPKGVQTAIDARIAMTYDVAAEGIFAKYGVPAITGSPTNSASISPFQAAIASPNGGFYVVTIDAAEAFTINMANVGAVKIYVQQEDYEVDNTKVNSAVNIGVVYGATAIPANSLLLFTTTIVAQTSTNGLTFTPAFKYTGAASGVIRVPTQADLANIATAVLTTGLRALVLTTGGSGVRGEYFWTGTVWQISTTASPAIDSLLTTGWITLTETFTFTSFDSTTRIGVIAVATGAASRYGLGQRVKFTQATGGVKYGIIHAIADTALTVFFPVGTTLVNQAITLPAFSPVASPLGFDRSDDLWTLTFTDSTERTIPNPTAGVWYNVGGLGLPVGVGAWKSSFQMQFGQSAITASRIDSSAAISTSNTTASDSDLIAGWGLGSAAYHSAQMTRSKTLRFATPQTLYAIQRCGILGSGGGTLYMESQAGIGSTLIIKATSAWA